jgi:hypothetical protein
MAHYSNQIASFLRNSRTSGSPMTYFPSPIPPESLMMPADDGFRLDHDQRGTPNQTTIAIARPIGNGRCHLSIIRFGF